MHSRRQEFYSYVDNIAWRIKEQAVAFDVIEYCATQLAHIGRTPLTDLDRRLINYIAVTQAQLAASGNMLSLAIEHEYDLVSDQIDSQSNDVTLVDPYAYKEIGQRILLNDAFKHILLHSIDYDQGSFEIGKPFGEARTKPSTALATIATAYLTELAIAIETAANEEYSLYRMVRKTNHIHYDKEGFRAHHEYKAINRGILQVSKKALPILISDEEREHCLARDSRPIIIGEGNYDGKESFIRPIHPRTNGREHFEFRKGPRGEPEGFYPLTAQIAVLMAGVVYGVENPGLEYQSPAFILTSTGSYLSSVLKNSDEVDFAHWVKEMNAHTMSHDPVLRKLFGADLLAEYRLSEMKKKNTIIRGGRGDY